MMGCSSLWPEMLLCKSEILDLRKKLTLRRKKKNDAVATTTHTTATPTPTGSDRFHQNNCWICIFATLWRPWRRVEDVRTRGLALWLRRENGGQVVCFILIFYRVWSYWKRKILFIKTQLISYSIVLKIMFLIMHW